jgi:peptidase M28-like protein
MKVTIFIAAFLTALQFLGQMPVAEAQETAGVTREIDRLDSVIAISEAINEERVSHLLGQLSGETEIESAEGNYYIETRHTYSAGNELARRYLIDYFAELGLEAVEDPFEMEWSGGTTETANIVVDIPGISAELLLCTAHFDSTAGSEDVYDYALDPAPGADDNGTGVVACLIAAEQLADKQLEKTVRIVLFSGEEQGLFGSRHYAEVLIDSGARVEGIINIDMIGPEPYAEHDFLPIYFRDHGEQGMFDASGLGELFYQVGTTYDFGLDIRPYWGAVVVNSDQFPFWYSGYQAVFINHGSNSDGYHTFADTMDTVDIPYATSSIRAIVSVLAHGAGIEGNAVLESTGQPDLWEDDSTGGGGCNQVDGNNSSGLAIIVLLLLAFYLRRTKLHQSALISVIAVSLIATGCIGSSAEGDEKSDMVEYMIEKGKAELVDGDTTGARRTFAEILENYDAQNSDAMFGVAFCDTLDVVALLNMLGAYMIDTPTQRAALSTLQVDPEQALTLYAEEIFNDIEQTAARNIELLGQCRGSDFNFDISGLPFYFLIGDELLLDLEIIASDVALIKSFWQLMHGLSSYINALDLNAPILERYNQTDSATSWGYVPYINMIVALLGDSPTFLDLKGQGEGALKTEQARNAFETAFADLAAAMTEKQEQKELVKSLIRYGEDEYNGWLALGGLSESELAKDNYLIEYSAPGVEAMRDSFLVFCDSFAGIGRAVEIPGDIVSFLAPIAEIAVQIIFGDETTVIVDTTISMIPDMIPNPVFALDMANYFAADAKGLRHLLPAYQTSTEFEENLFMFEWECTIAMYGVDPYPNGPYGLFCHRVATLTDREHFGDSIYSGEWSIDEIAADGIESSVPYLPLPDPTFNGMLSLDGYPLGVSGDTEGMDIADNYTLNGIVAVLFSGFGNFF